MDLKGIAEVYQSIQEGKVNPGLQAYLDKKKGKKENGDEKEEENGKESKGSKPDFLDLDKDGDKKEPMKKAAKEKKEETEHNYVNAYLDELKKTTMGSYIKKAAKDVADRSFDHGESEKRQYEPDKETDKEGKKIDNRVKGIQTAAKKMTKEHHQKDADGKVIEHEDVAPSSVEEEKTVLSKLTENGEELDMFDAVVAYLIDEGFAKTLEEAQKIMPTLKTELVQEVYQNQLWTIFDKSIEENRQVAMNPEKYKDPDESDKPYRQRSKAARMRDPKRGINSAAFKKFMADRGM
tara:strand:- start:365 stop:1243 length:879 start_codon:yes stop_codon:yes gene_type:complete